MRSLANPESRMQPILRDVQQIQSSDEAFAAILGDGTVVTWGQDQGLSEGEDLHHRL